MIFTRKGGTDKSQRFVSAGFIISFSYVTKSQAAENQTPNFVTVPNAA